MSNNSGSFINQPAAHNLPSFFVVEEKPDFRLFFFNDTHINTRFEIVLCIER